MNPVEKYNQAKDRLIEIAEKYVKHLESMLESRDKEIEALENHNKILKKITELELPIVESYEKALQYGEDLSEVEIHQIILLTQKKNVIRFALLYQQHNQGKVKFSKKELEVVDSYVRGIPRMETAKRLNISMETLKFHEKNIRKKGSTANPDKDFNNDNHFDFYKDLSPETRDRIRLRYKEGYAVGTHTEKGKQISRKNSMTQIIAYNKKTNSKINAKKMGQKLQDDYSEAKLNTQKYEESRLIKKNFAEAYPDDK